MASCVVLTPAEVVKQNAQMLQRGNQGATSSSGSSSAGSQSTSLQALKHLGSGGAGNAARRLLSGYTAMVARNLPFTAIQFPIFEYVRAAAWDRRRRRSSSGKVGERSLVEIGLVTGASAGLAGSFSAFVTTPMDVVKTRMMLMAGSGVEDQDKQQRPAAKDGGGEKTSPKISGRGQSGLEVARKVIKERGINGLFRGAVLRAVWTAVGSGLYLGMYEVSKVWLTGGKMSGEDDSFP
ncbi:mitochondrial carrier domain-containing protein [Xylariales sp. PMI_506]|nr:mitochondrial carrier domain-containing protein [Xylariales sp. PMI_506]